jgi:hypothetical protein
MKGFFTIRPFSRRKRFPQPPNDSLNRKFWVGGNPFPIRKQIVAAAAGKVIEGERDNCRSIPSAALQSG